MIDVRGSRTAIRRAYGIFSVFYPLVVTPFEKPAIDVGLRRAEVRRGERVLDVGCGAGNVLAQLTEQAGAEGIAIGLDFTPRMLAAARRRAPRAPLVRADALHLPFAEESFDVVWSSYMLDLLPEVDIAGVLREFRRVLRPGGRVALVSFTKAGEKLTLWERAYLHTPDWMVPYIFGSCRPIRLAPFVEAAGFAGVESEMVPRGMRSEVVTGRKP